MIAFRNVSGLVLTGFPSGGSVVLLDCIQRLLRSSWLFTGLWWRCASCNRTFFLAIHFCLYLEMEIDLTFCFSLNFDDVVQRNSLSSYSLLSIPWDGKWLDILFFTELWWRCATKLGIQTFSTRNPSDHKQSMYENTCKGSCRFYYDIFFVCIVKLHTFPPARSEI